MRRHPPRDEPPRGRPPRREPRPEGPFERLLRQRPERDPAPIIIGGTIAFLAIVIVLVFVFSSLLGGGSDNTVSGGSSDTVEVAPGINGRLSEMPALPPGLSPASRYIEFETEETVSVTIALPLTDNSPDPTGLGFYTFGENTWSYVADSTLMPAQEFASRGCIEVETAQGGQFVSCSDFEAVPQNLAVLRVLPGTYQVAASLPQGTSVHGDAGDVTIINPRDYVPAAGGAVRGTATEVSSGEDVLVMPTIVGSSEDTAAVVNDIIADETLRAAHVQKITAVVETNGYDGIDLEYSSVDAGLGSDFTSFVAALAEALHGDGKRLSLTLPPPANQRSAYDWAELGRAADYIKVLPIANPVAYWETMPGALAAITDQVDPQKVLLVINPYSIDGSGDVSRPIGYLQAMSLAGEAAVREPTDPADIQPGTTVEIVAKNLDEGEGASPMRWDDEALVVSFATSGTERRRIYIENVYSVSFKLELVQAYGLGGLAVADGSGQSDVANVWPAVREFIRTATVNLRRPNATMLLPIWQAPDGGDLGAGAGTTATWVAARSGDYTIILVVSDGERRFGQNTLIVVQGSDRTTTPTPPSTFAPETKTPTPEPTEKPSESPSPGAGVLVEVGKLAEGDDDNPTYSNGELVTPGSPVVYLITIDNDSDVPVTVTSLQDSIFGDVECLDEGGESVVGAVLAPDDGDDVGVIDGGADEIRCTFTENAPEEPGAEHTNVITVVVEDEEGNVDSDQDGTTVFTSSD